MIHHGGSGEAFYKINGEENEDIKTMEKYLHTSISLNHSYERIIRMQDDGRHGGTKNRAK